MKREFLMTVCLIKGENSLLGETEFHRVMRLVVHTAMCAESRIYYRKSNCEQHTLTERRYSLRNSPHHYAN